VSAISLIASTVGIAIIIVAIFESFTSSIIVGDAAINRLLGAVTVILVSGPVWVRFWSRIQRFTKTSEQEELASPIRRIYLFLLFGVGGIAAIISLITVVFQIFDGILSSTFGNATLNEMRFALGILISTGIVAAYHWEIYRHEKDIDVSFGAQTKSVLLVGPTSPELIQKLKAATGAKVSFLQRADASELVWPTEHVIELVAQSKEHDLLILLEATGVKVVPVTR
jgi:hypothetical protein